MTDSYMRSVGIALRRVRERRGLTLGQVQIKSAGVWKSVTVGSYERGERNPTLGGLHALATWYGVRVADLLPDGPSDTSAAIALADAVAALGWTPPAPPTPPEETHP